MPLPQVPPDAISVAMRRFDSELRTSPEWANWEANHSHRFAIKKENGLYPVKHVISKATEAPVSPFSGGTEANSYLTARGFDIERLHIPTESETRLALHELLLERVPNPITPQAHRTLADCFDLSPRLRTQTMQNSNDGA
jgi:hypothetical protein